MLQALEELREKTEYQPAIYGVGILGIAVTEILNKF